MGGMRARAASRRALTNIGFDASFAVVAAEQ
jgi:hypothetical protein